MPVIDFGKRRHAAFLPYGVLVMDGKVIILPSRFHILLSFPDLTMGTFIKIMTTAGEIKKILEALTE